MIGSRRPCAWRCPAAPLLGQAGGDEIVIPARNCSARSPNVKPADPAWDDLMVCYGAEGFVEWTFDLSAAGDYYLHT